VVAPAAQGADGVALYNQKKFGAAAAALSAEIRSNKSGAKLATLYYYLGCCYYQSKQIEEAKRIYRYIRNAFPQSNEARMAGTMLGQLDPTIASAAPAPAAPAPAEPLNADNPSDKDVLAVAKQIAAMASAGGSPSKGLSADALRVLQSAAARSKSLASSEDAELKTLPDTGKFNFKRGPSGHMDVTISVNGHPMHCWFDTGAGAFFGRGQLQAAGVDLSKAEPAGYTSGWAGNRVKIWQIPAEVQLGTIKRRIPIVFQEASEITPLIGQDFVRGYQYEIDDKAGVVTMKKTFGDDVASKHVDSLYDVPCRQEGRDDVIDLTVNGRKCKAFIDTGAFSTIIHPSTARQLGIEIPPDAEVEYGSGVGGSFAVRIVYLDLRCGPIHKPDFKVRIGGTAGNCIGQDFMEGWRVKVDRERSLMRFFH
jgi:predicted aspartyl protease